MSNDDSILASPYLRNRWLARIERPITREDIDAGIMGCAVCKYAEVVGDTSEQAEAEAARLYPDWTVSSVKNREVMHAEHMADMIAWIFRDMEPEEGKA